MIQIYEKWRELEVDPFEINFKKIKLKEIISYPPAQNDVIECVCEYNENDVNVIIKIERSKKAEFDIENSHLMLLNEIHFESVPNVIEYGMFENKKYVVLSKIEGERLSDIFKNNDDVNDRKKYLLEYGRCLASIHNIKFDCEIVKAKQRKINDFPKADDYENIPSFLNEYIEYLMENRPKFNYETFIHGDFHYANILWDKFKTVGLLDWEYSGYGFKEQDIAWACILRPTQYFMDNLWEIDTFLDGYLEVGDFNKTDFYWCLLNGYCHFYLMNLNNEEYKKRLKKLIVELYNIIK